MNCSKPQTHGLMGVIGLEAWGEFDSGSARSRKNVFSAGMKLIQFVSTLFFVFCWSTPLGRVSRDFVIGRCLVFKVSKSS